MDGKVLTGNLSVADDESSLRADVDVSENDVLHKSLRQSRNRAGVDDPGRRQILDRDAMKMRGEPGYRGGRIGSGGMTLG